MHDHIPRFFEVAQLAREADRDVIDMVGGEPDWEPPDGIRAGLHAYADMPVETFQYAPSRGLQSLREAIAASHEVNDDAVIVTNGTGEANYLAMVAALADGTGTRFIAVDPVYPYYPAKARMLGAPIDLVPTSPDGSPPVEGIAETATDETAAIIINTPNNPTGAVYSATKMAAIAEIADEVDAIVISDEVYDHFDYTEQFCSAREVAPDASIVTNAFSKSMAITGFRVGYALVPSAFRSTVRQHHLLINVSGSRPAQAAVANALPETPPDYYQANRDRMADRIDTFTAGLSEIGIDHVTPSGAFYVMAHIPGHTGSMATVKTLIDEAGVAAMPGDRFGDAAGDWVRFALLTPRIAEALDRLEAFVG